MKLSSLIKRAAVALILGVFLCSSTAAFWHGTTTWALNRIVNVAANGDSHTAYGTFLNSVTESLENRSFQSWLEMLMGWNYRHWKNYGVVAVKITDNTSYITNSAVGNGGPIYGAMNALSPAPDMIFEMVGQNDGQFGATLLQMQTDYGALYDAYVSNFSASTRIIQQPIMPSSQGWGSIRVALNSWLSTYVSGRNPNYKFVDTEASIVDVNNSNAISSLYNHGTSPTDTIHLRPVGGQALAAALFALLPLSNLAPAPLGIYPYALDVVNAATSDPTNILRRLGAGSNADTSQWQFAGTGGITTNITGLSPTGWTASANIEWTTSAGSQPAISVAADGSNLQAVTFTFPSGNAPNTSANASVQLLSSSISATRTAEIGITNGQEYRGGVRLEGSGLIGLTTIRTAFTWTIGGTQYFRSAIVQVNGTTQLSTDYLGATIGVDILTPELLIPASGAIALTSMAISFNFVPGEIVGGSVTIKRPYNRQLSYLTSGNPS